MKPEELVVGMWFVNLNKFDYVRRITALVNGYVCCELHKERWPMQRGDIAADVFCADHRPATAAEVRQHAPESDWPQWARDNLPNPHAKPAADQDGLVWRVGSARGAWCRNGSDIEKPGVWACEEEGRFTVNGETWTLNFKSFDFIHPRPRWVTPDRVAEIKRLLGVEAEAKPLPWDKPDELRTVDGRKIVVEREYKRDELYNVRVVGSPDHWWIDKAGRLYPTDIPIIRLATAAELEAEKPKPPTPQLHLDLSHYHETCVAVHFPGMKLDRMDGDETAVFVRVEGGGE